MSEQTKLALLEELELWLSVENQKIRENIRSFKQEVSNNEQ